MTPQSSAGPALQGQAQPGLEAILMALLQGGLPQGNLAQSPPLLGGLPNSSGLTQQPPAPLPPGGFPIQLQQGLGGGF